MIATAIVQAPGAVEPTTQPLRVLLVEDDPSDIELVLYELRSGGFEVVMDAAQTEDEFRKQLEGGAYDIVLTDYSLPQWRGMEALKLLRANNYDVVYAADGLSAMAVAQKEHPDLIILDIGMPAGDGFTVMDRLQRSAVLACIPVIILTARDPQYTKDKALKAGAAAFFQKPADNEELLGAIKSALQAAVPQAAPSSS